jgi:hypothetical protein
MILKPHKLWLLFLEINMTNPTKNIKSGKNITPDWNALMQPAYQEVDIAGVGTIRTKTEMSGKDLLDYQEHISQTEKDGMVALISLAAFRVQRMVVNENGEPVFGSIEDVLKLPADVISKISELFDKTNNALDEQVNEAAKK